MTRAPSRLREGLGVGVPQSTPLLNSPTANPSRTREGSFL